MSEFNKIRISEKTQEYFENYKKEVARKIAEYFNKQKHNITNPKANLDIEFDENTVGLSNRCPFCGKESEYNMKYDSYFCSDCNIWLEPPCDDNDCTYCKNRPDRPL